MNHKARGIFHLAPRRVAMQEIDLAAPAPGQLLIRARCSALSAGTESLIQRGGVPQDLPRDSLITGLAGGFHYPFEYGYALVGEVIGVGAAEDETWLGRRVFAFHPHRDFAVVAVRDCRRLPDSIPDERALFLPFLETALTLVLDAAPLAGERALVCGQGVIGLLVSTVLSRFPLAELIASDPIALRRAKSVEFGAGTTVDPGDAGAWEALRRRLFGEERDGLDFAVEVSGRIRALNQTLDLCGFGGRIVLGSWYGHDDGAVDLGGLFHRRRIRLLSSQVSTLNPELSGRWTKSRLWNLAGDWLETVRPERLITHRLPLEQCETAFALAQDSRSGALQIVFDYR